MRIKVVLRATVYLAVAGAIPKAAEDCRTPRRFARVLCVGGCAVPADSILKKPPGVNRAALDYLFIG